MDPSLRVQSFNISSCYPDELRCRNVGYAEYVWTLEIRFQRSRCSWCLEPALVIPRYPHLMTWICGSKALTMCAAEPLVFYEATKDHVCNMLKRPQPHVDGAPMMVEFTSQSTKLALPDLLLLELRADLGGKKVIHMFCWFVDIRVGYTIFETAVHQMISVSNVSRQFPEESGDHHHTGYLLIRVY